MRVDCRTSASTHQKSRSPADNHQLQRACIATSDCRAGPWRRAVNALERKPMQETVKLVPVLVLLTASVSILAQERTGGTEPKSSSQQMMVIDPKVRDQMMATTKDMDKQLQELKTCVDRERAAAASTGRPITASEREALDAQIQA